MSMYVSVVAVLALAVAGAAFAAPDMTSVDSALRDRVVAWDKEDGGGKFYKSTDSSDLGWSESGMLATYYHMYAVTNDTRWLDRIAQHADVVFANATKDSRGHFGWYTSKFSKAFAKVAAAKGNKGDGTPASKDLALNGMDIVPKVTGHRYTLTALGDNQFSLHDDTTNETVDTSVVKDARMLKIKVSEFEVHLVGDPQPGDKFTVVTTAPESVDYVVHEGMLFWPIASFVETVLADKLLDSRYGDAARRYLKMMDERIIPCWEDRWRDFAGGGGAYLATNVPTHRFPDTVLPHNQYLAMGRAFFVLYRITGKKVYLDRATKMARFFHSKLRRTTDGYIWNYWDPGRPEDASGMPMQRVEDSSHASIDIAFAVDAFEMGVVFTKEDLQLMAATYVKHVWNQSKTNPLFGQTLDRAADPEGKSDGKFAAGWQMLRRYSPEVTDAIAPLHDPMGKWFSPVYVSEWLYAKYAKPTTARVINPQ